MGAPGLAFETWDPSNQFPLETPTLLFVTRSEAGDLQCAYTPNEDPAMDFRVVYAWGLWCGALASCS